MLVAAVVVVKVSLKVTKAVDSALLLALPCRPMQEASWHTTAKSAAEIIACCLHCLTTMVKV